MKDNTENEEDMIRLGQILDTIRKDAVEVCDLLVTGIKYYNDLAWVCIFAGVIMIGLSTQYISEGNFILLAIYVALSALFFVFAPYSYRKNRRLRRKYAELIEIHKSLAEE